MIRINLLPYRAARKTENIVRQVTFFFIFIILVAVGMFFYNMQLNAKINDLNAKIEDIKIKIKKTEKVAQKVDQIKKELDTLKRKMLVIQDLKSTRKEPVLLMGKMTEVMVKGRMWLTSLGETGNTINANGIALDNKTVADFMINLEQASRLDEEESAQQEGETRDQWEMRLKMSRWFANVNLRTLSQKSFKKNLDLKDFQINFTKRPVPKPATKKAEK